MYGYASSVSGWHSATVRPPQPQPRFDQPIQESTCHTHRHTASHNETMHTYTHHASHSHRDPYHQPTQIVSSPFVVGFSSPPHRPSYGLTPSLPPPQPHIYSGTQQRQHTNQGTIPHTHSDTLRHSSSSFGPQSSHGEVDRQYRPPHATVEQSRMHIQPPPPENIWARTTQTAGQGEQRQQYDRTEENMGYEWLMQTRRPSSSSSLPLGPGDPESRFHRGHDERVRSMCGDIPAEQHSRPSPYGITSSYGVPVRASSSSFAATSTLPNQVAPPQAHTAVNPWQGRGERMHATHTAYDKYEPHSSHHHAGSSSSRCHGPPSRSAMFPSNPSHPSYPPPAMSDSDPTLTASSSHRPNARLGGSNTLDAYFGSAGTARVATTPAKRHRRPRSNGADRETQNKRAKVRRIEEEDDADINSTKPPPSVPYSSPSLSNRPPPDPAELHQFNQRFAAPAHGFTGRAISYLKHQRGVTDLSDCAPSVLHSLRACIDSSVAYSMSVFNQDLSTNFRSATNAQRKFARERLGTRRKEEVESIANGGVKTPMFIIIEMWQRQPAHGDNSADSNVKSSVDTTPLSSRDPYSIDSINPYPFSCDGIPSLVRSGIFMLPLFKSIKLAASSDHHVSEDARRTIDHHWQLRQIFIDLLEQPPPLLHGVLFDAKSVICALLAHFHVSRLSVDQMPQMADAKIAAWMCDPDDTHDSKFTVDGLMEAWKIAPPAGFTRVSVGPPGDRDIDVMMQDQSDVRRLFDGLARRMQQQQLLQAYVRQEMRVLPVVIEMQLRGIAIDLSLFDIAKVKLDEKLRKLVNHKHNRQWRCNNRWKTKLTFYLSCHICPSLV